MRNNQTCSLLKKSVSLLIAALMLVSVFTVSFAGVASADEFEAGLYEVTTANINGTLNMRASASDSATVLVKIPNGTPLTIYSIENGFGYTAYSGQYGWVSLDYVTYLSSFYDYPTGLYRVSLNDSSTQLIIRDGTDVSNDILGRIPHGTQVQVTETSPFGWGKVTYKGVTGWVYMNYLVAVDVDDMENGHEIGEYTVTTVNVNGHLNLRIVPDLSGEILAEIPNGTELYISQVTGNWGFTNYKDKFGWVTFDYLTTGNNGGNGGSHSTGKYKVVTTSTGLNIRSAPGTYGTIIGSVPKGTVVTVTAVQGSWGYITYNGVSGWVNFDFLEPYYGSDTTDTDNGGNNNTDTDPGKNYDTGVYTVTTAQTGLNMRKEPNMSAQIICSIPRGTVIEITDVSGEWGYTTYDGKSGWVNMGYLTPGGRLPSGDTDTNYDDFETGTHEVVLTSQTLQMREQPNASAAIVQKLYDGTILIIDRVQGEWGYCTYDGLSGWVNMNYLQRKPNYVDYPIGLYEIVTVNDNGNLQVRPTSGTQGKSLGMIPNGEEIEIIDIGGLEDDWGYVEYQDPATGELLEGWVYMDYLSLIESYEEDNSDTDTDPEDTDTDPEDTDTDPEDTDTDPKDTDTDPEDTDTDPEDTDTDGILYGDVDCNGKVNMEDVTLFQRSIAGLSRISAQGKINADVDGNGKRNLEDVVLIQRYIAKLIKVFPAEKM